MAVDLLLVGRTGNGRSSTGNSILGKKVFKPSSGSQLGKAEVMKDSATIDGQLVSVVDGPGLGDSSLDKPEDVKSTLDMVEQALSLSPQGFTAVVLVLKYGVRFTKQEMDAVKTVKSFFGKNVIMNYGVIIMTHGDSFDLDMEEEDKSFEDWCKEQCGDVHALFKECSYRCVLFDNKSKDEQSMKAQYKSLMSMVARIQTMQGRRYTQQDFQAAESDRQQILVASKVPELQSETRNLLDEVYSQLGQLDQVGYQGNGDHMLLELNRLDEKLQNYKRHLEKEAKGTDVLKQLLQEVGVAEMNLKAKRIRASRAIPVTREPTPSSPTRTVDGRTYTALLEDGQASRTRTDSDCHCCLSCILSCLTYIVDRCPCCLKLFDRCVKLA